MPFAAACAFTPRDRSARKIVKSRSLRGLTDFQPHTNPDNPLQPFYTRAGSFTPDSDGLLRNAAGFYLKGWTLNPDGSMPANRSAPRNQPAKHQWHRGGTTQMSLDANLQASAVAVGAYAAGDMFSGAVTPEFHQSLR